MGVNYSHLLIAKDNDFRPEQSQITALIEAWIESGFIIPPEMLSEKERLWSHTGARIVTKPSLIDPPIPSEAPKPRPGMWAKVFPFLTGERPRPRVDRFPPRPFSIPPVGESLAALLEPVVYIDWKPNGRATYLFQTSTFKDQNGARITAYPLRITLTDDFQNPPLDGYADEPLRHINGRCGCGANLEYWEYEFIRRICPQCGAAFRPQDQVAETKDVGGSKIAITGGACHRFSIDIRCEKDAPIAVTGPSGEDVFDSNGQLMISDPKVSVAFMAKSAEALGIELQEIGVWY